jgi:hypothetical protein
MKNRKQFKTDELSDSAYKTEEIVQSRNSKNSDDITTDDYDDEKFQPRKRNTDNDFRKKYKTEICKFWSINQTCKFGDKVNILLKF